MNKPTVDEFLGELFAAVDSRDTSAFLKFLAEDGVFRFGNLDAVAGKENVAQFVDGFFASIGDLSHQVSEAWEVEGGISCHGQVTYTRLNGSLLNVPFSLVLKFADGDSRTAISDYLIFADTSALYG